MNKILVILGPTATGKSDLSVKLAKKYNGEIISADSRQVYKGLNIGTGKITKKEKRGIHHWMLDVVSPKKTFTVTEWKKLAEERVEKILKRHKLPIICGGTGFYIQALVDGLILPEVPPDKKLRKELEKKSLEELIKILKTLDPERLSNIDTKNKVRLVRAIEVAKALGKVPEVKSEKKYESLKIGLTLPDNVLHKKISTRLLARIKKGMIEEAQKLNKRGLSFKRMRELGLEYRYLADYLDKRLSKTEMIQKLETEIWHYAKRQITWFKRDKKIKWFVPRQNKEIAKEIEKFIKTNPSKK